MDMKKLFQKIKCDDTEECALCRKKTDVLKSAKVQNRRFYVDGAGQLCESCWKKLYATDTEMARLSNESKP